MLSNSFLRAAVLHVHVLLRSHQLLRLVARLAPMVATLLEHHHRVFLALSMLLHLLRVRAILNRWITSRVATLQDVLTIGTSILFQLLGNKICRAADKLTVWYRALRAVPLHALATSA